MNSEDMETHPTDYLRNLGMRPMIDLNVVPVVDNHWAEETLVNLRMQIGPANSQGRNEPQPNTLIDLEETDDDVIILSPRAFAKAKNNYRRNHRRPVMLDADFESCASPTHRSKHGRSWSNQTCSNFHLHLNLEGLNSSKVDDAHSIAQALPQPPSKPPSYSCPVCLGLLVEETATKCGHIFCNDCIRAAITTKNQCPTCRRKVNMKDLIRVYLPSSS